MSLAWTKAPPTAPGWYWHRAEWGPNGWTGLTPGKFGPYPIEIVSYEGRPESACRLFVIGNGSLDWYTAHHRCEWAGPIEAPA